MNYGGEKQRPRISTYAKFSQPTVILIIGAEISRILVENIKNTKNNPFPFVSV